MGGVDDFDLLDAGTALAYLVRVDDEGPYLVAGRLDRDGTLEMHTGPPGTAGVRGQSPDDTETGR